MNRTTTRLLVAAAMAVVMLASCADAAGWYPSGTATVAGSYEYDDLGVRSLVVTATIENAGVSTISLSTFTITAVTGVRTYWKTVTSETRVLVGAKVKVTSAIVYADAAETLAVDGLSISDAFFE